MNISKSCANKIVLLTLMLEIRRCSTYILAPDDLFVYKTTKVIALANEAIQKNKDNLLVIKLNLMVQFNNNCNQIMTTKYLDNGILGQVPQTILYVLLMVSFLK